MPKKRRRATQWDDESIMYRQRKDTADAIHGATRVTTLTFLFAPLWKSAWHKTMADQLLRRLAGRRHTAGPLRSPHLPAVVLR